MKYVIKETRVYTFPLQSTEITYLGLVYDSRSKRRQYSFDITKVVPFKKYKCCLNAYNKLKSKPTKGGYTVEYEIISLND